MIDLHCHILPGIDDGASSIQDTLNMAQQAHEDGVTHILATPHHHNRHFVNHAAAVRLLVEETQRIITREGIDLTVFPGQEVRIHPELIRHIDEGDILFADEGNRYMMLEFPTMSVPDYTDQLFYDLTHRGIIPVIVHPERNMEIKKNPNKLMEWIDLGCLTQVTAGSIAGDFGKETQELSFQMVDANLTHIIASDAHNVSGRPFRMTAAFEVFEKEFSTEKAQLFKDRAKDIINGDDTLVEPYSEVASRKRKWFNF